MDHVAHAVALYDGEPRMQGPVGVPAREGRVVGPVRFPDPVVVPAKLPVHVAVGRRGDHRVVHGRVEDALRPFVAGDDLHAPQLLLPGSPGLLGYLLEVPVGNLPAEVLEGVLLADR